MQRLKLISILVLLLQSHVYCQEYTADPISVSDEIEKVNTLLNSWHHAAAMADENVFFGSMAKDCIYLGTDPQERWTKDEFMAWGMKYFERESAWDFKPFDRHIIFSDDNTLAWFDELLETWMGTCRGSGVLKKIDDGQWIIMQYNLAVTIPNEIIKEYISILQK